MNILEIFFQKNLQQISRMRLLEFYTPSFKIHIENVLREQVNTKSFCWIPVSNVQS